VEYKNQKYYDIDIRDMKRRLPVVKVKEGLWIASFVILGDVELTSHCADELKKELEKLEFDYLVGPEAKVLPLLHIVAERLGFKDYIVCRKERKAYMKDAVVYDVKSITTQRKQQLVLNGSDAEKIKGKKVVLLDDVVSTGGTFNSMEKILEKAGAEIVGRAAVLKEGDTYKKDVIYLEELPIFTK
jgi:adenine phosphoribosyltransferase